MQGTAAQAVNICKTKLRHFRNTSPSVPTVCPVQVPGSLLSELFSGMLIGEEACVPRDAGGSYFVDRDGPSFRYVLNYLRAPAGDDYKISCADMPHVF